MADQTTKAKNGDNVVGFGKSFFAGTSSFFSGVWLVFLYITFVSLVVFSLGAHQLQYSIRSFRVDEGRYLPLWAVAQIYSNWIRLEKNIDDLRYALIQRTQELKDLVEAEATAGPEPAENSDDPVDGSEDGEASDGVPQAVVGDDTIQRDSNQAEGNPKAAAPRSAPACPPGMVLKPVLEPGEAGEPREACRFTKSGLNNQIAFLTSEIEQRTQQQSDMLTYDKIELDSSVGDFILSMRFYKETIGYSTIFGGILPDFMSLPPEVLTIILVLSMGALGGTIHLTRNYFDADRRRKLKMVQTIGYYIFRPFLGAITALSIYILAKAGILVFANPSTAAFGGALSPFFVSFLGIISGLLAEQAVETIQRTGQQWFASSPNIGRDRWAVRVREHLKPDEEVALANTLGVSQEVLSTWLDLKVAVPGRQQKTIAAWLRRPVAELFTDVDPNVVVEEPKEADAPA